VLDDIATTIPTAKKVAALEDADMLRRKEPLMYKTYDVEGKQGQGVGGSVHPRSQSRGHLPAQRTCKRTSERLLTCRVL
jgi:hypothetical protein